MGEIKRPAHGWNIRRKPTHPGEMLLEEFMKPLELSANKLALDLRVPVTRISEIIHGRRGVSADTALRLERYFGMSAEFWMNMQRTFDLVSARLAHETRIKSEVAHRRTKAA